MVGVNIVFGELPDDLEYNVNNYSYLKAILNPCLTALLSNKYCVDGASASSKGVREGVRYQHQHNCS